MKRTAAYVAGVLVLPLALAACGGGSSGGKTASPPDSATVATVKAQSVSGVGDVLVDAQGRTLYTPDQESSGRVLCTGACTKVWLPVTVPAGSAPMADSDVTAKLGTAARNDGTTQVTAAGRPLYRFAFDKGAGQATGDDVSDAFGAQHFRWHVLTPAGDVAAATQPSPSATSSGYDYSY
ncbi:MAG: hypothetical protein QOJ03_3308 [Frankiaceae bacterium]|jgi:predicted lipoprotein with Yx(FWY)xxD motif|nr:hypothetical protein [Frankiaceae bacterium]